MFVQFLGQQPTYLFKIREERDNNLRSYSKYLTKRYTVVIHDENLTSKCSCVLVISTLSERHNWYNGDDGSSTLESVLPS